ncbi:MAG: sulfatase-like hydrolase/transferase, partial [Aeoliella sp.]
NKGKDDYNFVYDRPALYSTGNRKNKNGTFYGRGGGGDWADRPEGVPFFGQIQLGGGKTRTGDLEDKVSPGDVKVPPYFPDNDLFRKEWAHHYDCARVTDRHVARILRRLQEDGLLESTIVFFFTDHGNNHSLRHKQFCYEGGVHVPLVIAGPSEKLVPGAVRRDLVSGLDISSTTLALAGIPLPDYLDGQDLFADDFQPREFVISARDRCDYTIDHTRTVRTDQFRYLRNFLTDRPLLQPQYRDNRPAMEQLRAMHSDGTLDAVQEAALFGPRPGEELYDIAADPHQIHNLAADPAFADELTRHRKILEQWIRETDDQGQYPESDENLRAILKRWGEKCVNPEFDRLRSSS